MSDDPLSRWPAFSAAVRERLEAGRREYGDRSFSAEPGELLGEVREELLDVCAWGFILACRLEVVGEALRGEAAPERANSAARSISPRSDVFTGTCDAGAVSPQRHAREPVRGLNGERAARPNEQIGSERVPLNSCCDGPGTTQLPGDGTK